MPFPPTYTPKHTAQFIEKIAENLCLLVEARQAHAISLYKGELDLSQFQYVYRSSQGRVLTEYPTLMLETCRTVTAQIQRGIDEAHEFNFSMGIDGEDADTTTKRAYRYVKIVDSIWRSALSSELADGLTAIGGARIISTEHDYSPTGKIAGVDSQYLRVVGITLTLKVTEL